MCLLPLCKLEERSEQHNKKKFDFQQKRFWTALEAVDRLSLKDGWSQKRSKENFTQCAVATENILKPTLPWRFLDTEGISQDFSSLTLTITAKSMVCVDVCWWWGFQLPDVINHAKCKYLQLCPPADRTEHCCTREWLGWHTGMGSADCSFPLSSLSLSRQRTSNAMWLTGCLFVSDMPEWLLRHFDQPWRHKLLLRDGSVISCLPQQTSLGSDQDQLEVNAQIFNQCSPLLGGKQTEDRNQLL